MNDEAAHQGILIIMMRKAIRHPSIIKTSDGILTRVTSTCVFEKDDPELKSYVSDCANYNLSHKSSYALLARNNDEFYCKSDNNIWVNLRVNKDALRSSIVKKARQEVDLRYPGAFILPPILVLPITLTARCMTLFLNKENLTEASVWKWQRATSYTILGVIATIAGFCLINAGNTVKWFQKRDCDKYANASVAVILGPIGLIGWLIKSHYQK